MWRWVWSPTALRPASARDDKPGRRTVCEAQSQADRAVAVRAAPPGMQVASGHEGDPALSVGVQRHGPSGSALDLLGVLAEGRRCQSVRRSGIRGAAGDGAAWAGSVNTGIQDDVASCAFDQLPGDAVTLTTEDGSSEAGCLAVLRLLRQLHNPARERISEQSSCRPCPRK